MLSGLKKREKMRRTQLSNFTPISPLGKKKNLGRGGGGRVKMSPCPKFFGPRKTAVNFRIFFLSYRIILEIFPIIRQNRDCWMFFFCLKIKNKKVLHTRRFPKYVGIYLFQFATRTHTKKILSIFNLSF